MSLSLWLDEAWVANSVLTPTLSEMFYYDRWVQSTPPLFLLLTRLSTKLFGTAEIALRFVAWIAGAVGALLMALLLRRVFAPGLAFLGSTFFLVNYYGGKYSQQVKQYSSDLLAGVICLALIWRCLDEEQPRPSAWLLITVGVCGLLLSYTTVFWLPALILVIWKRQRAGGDGQPGASRWWHWKRIAAVYGACSLVTYLVFVLPNRAPNLVSRQVDRFIGSDGFTSLYEFAYNVSRMLMPHASPMLQRLSFLLLFVTLVGLVRCVASAVRGNARAQKILVAAAVPIVVGMAMSFARQYPLLTFPRFTIWMLPSCTVFLLFAVELFWNGVERISGGVLARTGGLITIGALCVTSITGAALAQSQMKENHEDVRAAVRYLHLNTLPDDTIYIHGGTNDLFVYYSGQFGWSPKTIYWGNTGWPCCALSIAERATLPSSMKLGDELVDLAIKSPRRLWLILPGTEEANWSFHLRGPFHTIPEKMRAFGYETAETTRFSGALIYQMRRTGTPLPADSIPVQPAG